MPERDRPAHVRRVRRAVDGAPGAVADCRQAVLAALHVVVGAVSAKRTDAPAHGARPARRAVKSVELALVQDIGEDGFHLRRRVVDVDEPNLVAVGTFDW